MRDFTTDQETAFFAVERQTLARVRIENSAGTMVEYTVAGGASVDWLDDAVISASVDEMAMRASVTLFREVDGTTLAPMMASEGSEAIKAGRAIEIYVGVSALGGSPDKWWLLFDGFIDDVAWGGLDSRISLTCRDEMGVLIDAWTVAENDYGSDASPVAIQTVMQALIDEVLTSQAPTLNVIGNPDFGILAYTQQMQSLADALKALVDLIGWDLRYVWSDNQERFRLTLREPDRFATNAQHSFAPADYYDVPEFGENSTDIRNTGIIKWGGGKITAEDDESINEYGRRRYIVLDATQDGQLNTEAKALALITAVVSDLSQPLAQQAVVTPLFPPVEINDYYEWQANNVHYATDQTMAVTAYEHRISADGCSTTMRLRGKPTGGVTRWTALRNRLEAGVPDEEDEQELEAQDIEFYFTTPYGSVGFDIEGERDESLGGFISITEISTDLNNLFRQVTDEEREHGITLYRSFGVVNNNASPVPKEWECVRAWLSHQGEHGVTWGLALDPQGVYPKAEVFSLISADEETAPGSLTYMDPLSFDDADHLSIGTVPAGHGFVVHVRLEVYPGATGQITDESVVFQDEVPATVSSGSA